MSAERPHPKTSQLRPAVLDALLTSNMEHPYRVVKMGDLARKFGCSRQTVRDFYNEFWSDHLLPPRIGGSDEIRGYLNRIITSLLEEGQSIQGIAGIIGLSYSTVVQKLKDSGVPIPTRTQRNQERDERIVRLRNIFNLGDSSIVRRTGVPRGTVNVVLQKNMLSGNATRLRKKRRSKEEVEALDRRIETSLKTSRSSKKIPIYATVSKGVGCTEYEVQRAIKRFRKQGFL